MILFVYGTLRRGKSNHHLMAGAEYLGDAVTLPKYRLHDLKLYVVMVQDEAAGDAVPGELFRVGDRLLAELDTFEGHPDLFRRTPVELADGKPAEAYLYARPIAAATLSATTVSRPKATVRN